MAWTVIGAGDSGSTEVNASMTLPAGSAGDINIRNATGGPISIVLPADPIQGQALKLKDVSGNAGTSNITIVGPVDGYPTYMLVSDYMAVELYWMGTQWGTR